jgi:hypothetical protein
MTTITQYNVVRCRFHAFDIEQARMNSVPRNTGLIYKGDEPAAETTGDLIRLVEEDSSLPGPEDLCRRLSFQLPDIKQKEDYSNCFANGD